ncbi:hypothetical protein WA1_51005 [Scytonema hofmannii PCC 7110]|uniref:Novel STAND NTPase 1 domain-containing protein n=1 Tax=Scytonema hofmannii PCC 7110 TaxID=128403 RepID=A0A139WQ41_9CYAN|nr:pentapeptide repeat-containing protein [Scytonema hofmannii]KYC34538.1 hypothetical protein WA1_51005 [Scytonema hofmannii PCC 7110]
MKLVNKEPLVAVIGPSGSGKSSVVFAGLIPYLKDTGGWRIAKFRPGKSPCKTLTEAVVSLMQLQTYELDQQTIEFNQNIRWLQQMVEQFLSKHPGERLLLVADQFEELYTLCEDEKERQQFLDQLLTCVRDAPKFTLLLTMRADFLHHALSYRPFVDELQNRDLKIGLMSQQDLQKVIEEPAKICRIYIENNWFPLRLETGLTERIISDVGDKAENLPLLEFTLTQLWKKQTDAQLTHKSYQEIGFVEQSIANHAEEVYKNYNDDERQRLERIFIQLINPEKGTAYTRRIATRTNLGEDNWELVTCLNSEEIRLVVINYNKEIQQETVEIIHEALIQNWHRLTQWMKKNNEFRTWQEELRRQICQWNNTGNDEGALLRGVPLAVAEDWQQKHLKDLAYEERFFIKRSLELQDKEIQQRNRETKQRERQQQRITIARTLAICLGIGVIGLIVLLNRETLLITFVIAIKKHLAGQNLEKFHMPRANLSQANLSRTNLSEANLEAGDLSEANLQDARLWKTHMPRANLSQANLSRTNLSEANLEAGNLSKANLQDARLWKTHMLKSSLQNANLSKADLSEANLKAGNLSKANLQSARLWNTYMPKSRLQDTNLSQANLSQADLNGSDFSRAKLNGANLRNTYMPEVSLQNTDLSQADLLQANLSKSDLSGADFRGVRNLTPEQVKSARNWEKAIYDEDFAKKLGLR